MLAIMACGFLIAVVVGDGLERASLWAAVLAALAGVVAAVAAIWPLAARRPKVPLPEATLPEWVVERPTEVAKVLTALLANGSETVGLTTGLHGAGGFGKTTLAQMVRADRRVRRRFPGGIYWVTVGRDIRGAGLATKVNDLIKQVANENATYSDPEAAGQRLGTLMDTGPRRLLIVDDVWKPEQLAPFTDGGRRCVRLVTTRMPSLLTGRGVAVQIDQMSPPQARRLLTSGLPDLDPGVAEGLLAVTGRWPLLLRLVNGILIHVKLARQDVSAAGAQLHSRLQADGPVVVDELSGIIDPLDVDKPRERARAVRATIIASTSLLNQGEAERFTELSIFAEDETIPFGLVARLWHATAGLEELEAAQVCARLNDLALVSYEETITGGLVLHDVLRDFLRRELGQRRQTELNGMLLSEVATELPVTDPLDITSFGPARAWWKLDADEQYLWDHLIDHLLQADQRSAAEKIACDLRWVGARVQHFGPSAAAADLSLVITPQTSRLSRVLARSAHLLAPTEPARAVVDILHSRVADDPDWGAQVALLRDSSPRPRLVNRWPLPDLPGPELRRIIRDRHAEVRTVAVEPYGSWLAIGTADGTVQIRDVKTGELRLTLSGPKDRVLAIAIAPNGTWLATGSEEPTVRTWDTSTGRVRFLLNGHESSVSAVAIAPDGRWLATGSDDGTLRIWDAFTGHMRATLAIDKRGGSAVAIAPNGMWLANGNAWRIRVWDMATGHEQPTSGAHIGNVYAATTTPDGSWLVANSHDETGQIWDAITGQLKVTLRGHPGIIDALTVAPDGNWLATGHRDGTVNIWDIATGQLLAALSGHTHMVRAMAVGPDSSWLATGSHDGTVRIWDATSAQQQAPRSHYSGINSLSVGPDSSWLATSSRDGKIRIWDTSSGRLQATLFDNQELNAVAISPDGSWLAVGSEDSMVRIWDIAIGQVRDVFTARTGYVRAIAISPNGNRLVTGCTDAKARIWDVVTGQQRATLTGHQDAVSAVAFSPDGRWLATGSHDGTSRIWDVVTGQQRATLTGHQDAVSAVAFSPDGRWLATGSHDGTSRIWDVVTGQQRATLTGHQGAVSAVAFSPDGRWLATGSHDGTLEVWDATVGQVSAAMRVEKTILACEWLNDGGLAVGGIAGLYLFDLLTGATSQASPGQRKVGQ